MKKTSKYIRYFIISLFIFLTCSKSYLPHQLKISENGHYIEFADSSPFLWLGDTGWAMFQQLTREQVDLYLDNRHEKGITVIQSVIYWYPHGGEMELGVQNAPNVYGHRPFAGDKNNANTSEPLIVAGGSPEMPNDYWDNADYVVQAVKSRGMYLALLPCWGNAYINNRIPGTRIEFSEEEARLYGAFLGTRYGSEPHIIWTLGGDVDPVNFGDQDQRHVYRAMAEGIGRAVSGNDSLKWNEPHRDWDATFMTFHAVQAPKQSGARGGSSSIWFHSDAWLDVNMMETFSWTDRIYPLVTKDYNKTDPVKPTILGEGAYEDGSYSYDCGWVTPLRVRRQAYHAFFAGAAGHTYGHWAVWAFRGQHCGNTWDQALDSPGIEDIGMILKNFLIKQELQTFVPDQSLILSDAGSGETMQCAMRTADTSKILVYFPEADSTQIALEQLPSKNNAKAIWFDPRNGDKQVAAIPESATFIPPDGWEDAVLVIDGL